MQSFIKDIEMNKYENVIENTLKALNSREAKHKALISTTLLLAINVAERYDFSTLDLNLVPGALDSLSFATMSCISAKTIINSIKAISSKIEFEDKNVEAGLASLLSVLNYFVLKGADGTILIAVILGLCTAALSGLSSKHKDIHSNLITLNCIADIDLSNIISYAVGIPVFTKLMTAHKKVPVYSFRDANNKTYIPFNLFRSGATPVIIAGYIVSILAKFIPIGNICIVKGALCFILNLIIGFDVDGKKVTKDLRVKGQVIDGVRDTEDYIERHIIYSNVIGGLILALMLAFNVNTAAVVIISTTLEKLYKKILCELNMR
ncbi:MAG: hypothetical protein ACRDB9_00475 [Cetobacterium sp.]